MKGELGIFFPVRWMVWVIWQGCQVKGQAIVEHSSISYFYAFQAMGFFLLIGFIFLAKSL
jgi:hypothetical protein